MKKIIAIFVAAVFVIGLSMAGINSIAFAGTAPQLTSIRVVRVYDNQGTTSYVTNTCPYTLSGNKTFKGGTLYVETKFTGYPNWGTVFYRDGRETGQAMLCTVVQRTPLYGKNRIAYGWKEIVAIPFDSFSGSYSTLYVSADSANGKTFITCVSGIHIQK